MAQPQRSEAAKELTPVAQQLTPARRAAIVARYQVVGNAVAVAREFEVGETTVRACIRRAAGAKKSEIHARACARGVREGRRALAKTTERIQGWLSKLADPDAPGMEPGDVARLATAMRGVVAGIIEIDEHRGKKMLSRLTRELRRKEIELAELRIKAGGVDQHQHSLVASVVVLPELDDGAVASEPRPADAVPGERGE